MAGRETVRSVTGLMVGARSFATSAAMVSSMVSVVMMMMVLSGCEGTDFGIFGFVPNVADMSYTDTGQFVCRHTYVAQTTPTKQTCTAYASISDCGVACNYYSWCTGYLNTSNMCSLCRSGGMPVTAMMQKNGAPLACFGRAIIFNNSDLGPSTALFTQNTVSVRISCLNVDKLMDLNGMELKCNNIITFEYGIFPTALYATIGNGVYTSAITIDFNLMTPKPVSRWIELGAILPATSIAIATVLLMLWVRRVRQQKLSP